MPRLENTLAVSQTVRIPVEMKKDLDKAVLNKSIECERVVTMSEYVREVFEKHLNELKAEGSL